MSFLYQPHRLLQQARLPEPQKAEKESQNMSPTADLPKNFDNDLMAKAEWQPLNESESLAALARLSGCTSTEELLGLCRPEREDNEELL